MAYKSEKMGASQDSSSCTDFSSSTILRLTRAVDIFSLGCLLYYVLMEGKHPFGERFERNMNIVQGRTDMWEFSQYFPEAHALVSAMLSTDPR